MNISIVFSTYNGEHTLPRMLEQLTKLDKPPHGCWNIIAVDNRSSDRSREILEQYSEKLPLTILVENKPGKNAALNRALTLLDSLGELIIFTDDDIIPPKNWLVAYQRIVRNNPDCTLFGGATKPLWEKMPPPELLEAIPNGTAYVITDDTKKTGIVSATSLWGPNMAARKEIFQSGIRFNEHIGPNGASYAMGSETDFLERVAATGEKAYFCKDMAVQHIIREWQLEKKWIKARALKAGRGLLRQQLRMNSFTEVASLFGFPRWALFKIVMLYLVGKYSDIFNLKKKAYESHWQCYLLMGFCYEYKRRNEKK